MADITDATAISFCNEFIRPVADLYAKLYYAAVIVKDQWNAIGTTAAIPNEVADEIIDGAQSDGRKVIYGADISTMMQRLQTVMDDLEASSDTRLKHILAIAVNPNTTIGT